MRILEIERINLDTSVNSKIAIILKLADSPLMVRYFTNPNDSELETLTFEEIESYRHVLAESVFWVNDIDKKFYFDKREPYVLDPKLPENYWYDMTLYKTNDYNFNINYNPDLNVINLWINAPVLNKENKPIGMVGSGVDISAFVQKLYKEYNSRANLYFFNSKGEITGAKDIELVIAKEHINNEFARFCGSRNDIFTKAKELKPKEMRAFSSAFGMAAIGTVPALEWYVIAVIPDSISDYNNHVSGVFIVMLAVMALIIVLFNIFIAIFIRSLHQTMDSLETTSRHKSEFLARMSHEIRTPMNAILGMSELALCERNLARTHEQVSAIKKSGTKLLAIINDILDFSKIESGKLEIILSDYLFSSLITDVISIIRMKVMESKLEFKTDIDKNIPKALVGDDSRIRQVLLNLLNNAVKYTPSGFVSFTVRETAVDDNNVILTFEIADSGRGIKEDDIQQLFDDFAQFDLAANKHIEGTGLGLAITRNLVIAMGGNISVRSEYGKGSVFTVTLPQSISTKESFETNIFVSMFKAPDARVLVVDDVSINRTVAQGLLSMYDIQVDTCASGEEALEAVMTGEYDMVFMDQMMPGMDGLEATAAIRTLTGERFQRLPIVALTANAISGVDEMFLKSGFSDYLSKPIDTQKLRNILEKWLPAEKVIRDANA